MSLPKFETDISYISKLDDEPNDVGGLDASQLKAEFDKAGLNIQEYINDVLLPYLEGVEAAASLGIATISGLSSAKSVQEALEALKAAIDNTAAGSIPDASLTGEKLAAKTIGSRELADAAVSAVNISAEAVTADKVAPKAVTGTKLADHVITADKLADGAVTNEKLADGAVDAGKLAANAVTNAKIANGAVSTAKVADAVITRAKLAQDALYSHNVHLGASSATFSLSSGSVGKTFIANNSTIDFVVTVPADASIPVGFEVALLRFSCKSMKITFADGIKVLVYGNNSPLTAPTFNLETYAMVALKKISGSDYWLLTGPAEVVS